jgi:poly(3-hydroxybutyrate) depolymerase
MRYTRSNGPFPRCTILLGALLLWQCTEGEAAMSTANGANAAGASGIGASGTAGLAGPTAGSLSGGSPGSVGMAGTTGGTLAGGSGGVGSTAGAGAAGTVNTPPTAGGGSGGFAAGAGGADAGSSGAAAGPATPSSGCGTADVPPSGPVDIEVDGTARELAVRVPASYDPEHPYRLVLAWHGLGGTATQTVSAFGLASRSEDSAIFIAGQALESQSGQQAGFASWATDGTDIEYARALIEWAKANYCIDGDRVFSIGVSNGGMMTNMVGCALGDLVRGNAAIAGGGPRPYVREACVGPVAAWITHGNQDNNVPFSYGEMSRDQWLELNGCDMTSMAVMPGPCLEYQGCADGYPVQFCEHDGGHTVPDFAAEAVWAFFSGF